MNNSDKPATMSNTPNSAEQILLEKVGKLALSGLKWKSLSDRKELIVSAMEEYATQQSAKDAQAFAEWIVENDYERVGIVGKAILWSQGYDESGAFTTAELYSGPYAEYKERNK